MAFLDGYTKYARYRIVKQKINELLPSIKQNLANSDKPRVLNAGGGYGYFHQALEEMGFDVVTCDISDAEIYCDLEKKLKFEDHSFDLVVSLAVLEHLDNWSQALSEFKRIAHYSVSTTPSIFGKPVLDSLAFLNLVNREHIADHKHYLTKSEIKAHGYAHRYFQFGLNQLVFHVSEKG